MAKSKKVPFAGKEKRAEKKLPVPGPTPAQQAASAAKSDKKATPAPRGSVALASKDFAGDLAIAARESAIDQGVIKPTADPKKEGVPVSLQVQNRLPLTDEQKAKVDAAKAQAKATSTDAKQAAMREAQKEAKAEKAKVKRVAKKEKAAAVAKGATTAMPLQGKEALKAIKAAKGTQTAPGKKNTTQASAVAGNGHLNKTRANDAKRQAAEAKANKAKAKAKGGKTKGEPKAKSKLAMIVALLQRKNGCTRADILEATGWPSVSVQQQAAAANLKLTIKKDGSVKRYSAA